MAAKKRDDHAGSIRYDKTRGRWELRLADKRLPKGVVTVTSTKSKRVVLAKRDEVLRNLEANKPPTPSRMTVRYALDYWRREVLDNRELAPSSRTRYEWTLDVLRAEYGTKKVRDLDVPTINHGLRNIAAGRHSNRSQLSYSSVARMRTTLIEVLDVLVAHSLIGDHHARLATVPKPAKAVEPAADERDDEWSDRRSFTPEETRRFIDACGSEGTVGALLTVIVTVGLRPGEAMALQWDSVNLDDRSLTVRRGVQMTGSKATVVPTLKTSKSYRTVALPADAVSVLADQPAGTLVFPAKGGRVMDPANVRRTMRRICEANELPALTPNELRHTCASLLVDAGVPLHVVADRLGHVDTRQLEQTYRHRIRPVVAGGVSEMDRLLEAR